VRLAEVAALQEGEDLRLVVAGASLERDATERPHLAQHLLE
jgi:hypothetical protein